MILYTEKQLEDAYRKYCYHHIKKVFSFMKLEDFRSLFEDMMVTIYQDNREELEDGHTL